VTPDRKDRVEQVPAHNRPVVKDLPERGRREPDKVRRIQDKDDKADEKKIDKTVDEKPLERPVRPRR
jgi:hypothetical protein